MALIHLFCRYIDYLLHRFCQRLIDCMTIFYLKANYLHYPDTSHWSYSTKPLRHSKLPTRTLMFYSVLFTVWLQFRQFLLSHRFRINMCHYASVGYKYLLYGTRCNCLYMAFVRFWNLRSVSAVLRSITFIYVNSSKCIMNATCFIWEPE